MAGAISNLPRDNIFVMNKQICKSASPNCKVYTHNTGWTMRALLGLIWKYVMSWHALRQLHILSLKKKNAVEHDTDHWSENNMAPCRNIWSNVLFASALIWSSWKNISKYQNFLLHLKYKLYHETVLTLTHISTTLSMHWGNWQLDWAEGLGVIR